MRRAVRVSLVVHFAFVLLFCCYDVFSSVFPNVDDDDVLNELYLTRWKMFCNGVFSINFAFFSVVFALDRATFGWREGCS